MNKNQKRLLAVIAILLVAFSVIAFALPFYKNGLFWLAYLFGLLALALQLYVLKVAFAGADRVKSRFYGFPVAKIGVIYLAAQLVLSLIFMALSAVCPLWVALVLFILLLAAAALGFIGADAMRDKVERQETKVVKDTACILGLRSRMATLASQCEDTEAKKALSALVDEFRFSDPVSSEALKPIEDELKAAVEELQTTLADGNMELILSACRKVSNILADRNRLCKQGKR